MGLVSTPPITARILVACPDTRGITAAVTGFIAERGGNLLDLDQHTVPDPGDFFLRAEFEPGSEDMDRIAMQDAFAEVAKRYGMAWRCGWSDTPRKVAIMASRELHCLHDLLWRFNAGEMPGEIVAIISNHEAAGPTAANAGIPFHHLPIRDGDKTTQEAEVASVLAETGADLVVLARYMQILSNAFVKPRMDNIINVHHSFLPAFPGADPYRQAYERGVKMIGATAHYATPELDEGPIIAQAVAQVSHHDSVEDLRRSGRELERNVLANAVRAHLEDRILVTGNRTVVFR